MSRFLSLIKPDLSNINHNSYLFQNLLLSNTVYSTMKFDNTSIATSLSTETNSGFADDSKRRSDSIDLDFERSNKRTKTSLIGSSSSSISSPLKLHGPFPGYGHGISSYKG
jgi:hypothetical protein